MSNYITTPWGTIPTGIVALIAVAVVLILFLKLKGNKADNNETTMQSQAVNEKQRDMQDKQEEIVAAISAAIQAVRADDEKLVAAITAVITAATETSSDRLVVRSLRKVQRRER